MNKYLVVLAICLLVCGTFTAASGQAPINGGYFTFVDESGNTVYATAWETQIGDELLTENNMRYEVISIDGNTAHVKLIGRQDLSGRQHPDTKFSSQSILRPPIAEAQGPKKIAIYHTHSDESYTPSDGSASIYGNGGVYKVGDAFAKALDAKGFQAIHSLNKHDPHDDQAYARSRRTVAELLKQTPDAIFDVHRDSLPPQYYQTTVDGQNLTKVQLVVGKYGPTAKQIEDYALRVKAAADQQHPGLIKGIFFAKGGDYNQDLHPRSLLLEVGSDTNTRPEAEKGIALFADVVPTVLGATSGNPGNTAGTTGLGTTNAGPSGASKSIGWIVGLLVVGVIAFLLLGTGSLREAGAKLKQFRTTEFANFFGPKAKEKKDEQNKPSDNDQNRP